MPDTLSRFSGAVSSAVLGAIIFGIFVSVRFASRLSVSFLVVFCYGLQDVLTKFKAPFGNQT